MPQRRIIALGVSFALLLTSVFGQQKKLIYDQLVRPAEVRFHHVPIGLCEDYPEESTTKEIIKGDMELLKRTGIPLLRIAFGWDGIETEMGKYDWGFWDDYVRTAVDDYGVTLVPYICYTPRWNSTGDSSNYWNHTPRDYDAFGRFVEVLVTRYKDRIKTWELWNEPDIKEFWSGNAEDLAKLTKIGAQAVRKADPTARVVLAGLAGHTDFTLALFKDFGISPYVDVVNCHSYYETWNGSPLEAVVPYVNTIADIIKLYGNNQSLWMAEVGYSTYRQSNGYVSAQYWCTYDYEHTPKYQAVALWRTLTLLLSTEKMAAITWYRLKDLPPGENVIGDVNNRHLGIDYQGYRPKPAEQAISFFNRIFSEACRCIDAETTVRKRLGSDSEVHCFEMEDGSIIVVGWLKTHISGRVNGEPIGGRTDSRREVIELSIPAKGIAGGTQYSEVGTSQRFRNFRSYGSTLILPAVTLTGGGISILKLTK